MTTDSPRRLVGRLWFVGVALIGAFTIGAPPRARAAEPLRTWTDDTGEFKMEARFVRLAGDTVVLEDEEGAEFEIELEKLSKADQKYIKTTAKNVETAPDQKPQADDPDPKQDKARGKKRKSGKGENEEEADAKQSARRSKRRGLLEANADSAELIELAEPEGEWDLKPDDSAKIEFAGKPKTIALPKLSNPRERMQRLVVNAAAKAAVVGFSSELGPDKNQSRIFLCNLATGAGVVSKPTYGIFAPIALHPDGQQVLMLSTENDSLNDRLEVWSLRGTEVHVELKWRPYGEGGFARPQVVWAEFIQENSLATLSSEGRFVVWKFPDIEAEYALELSRDVKPAISPNRKWLAYGADEHLGIFDLEQREVVAQRRPTWPLRSPQFAFSPSGKRLASASHDGVSIWNVANGALDADVQGLGIHQEVPCTFCGENFVLAGGTSLIDVENQVEHWRYRGHRFACSVGDWSWLAVEGNEQKPGALVATKLPHPGAMPASEQVKTNPGRFILKPGTKVAIDVEAIGDEEQREIIEDSLTQKLHEIECEADPKGTIELVASIEDMQGDIGSDKGNRTLPIDGGIALGKWVSRLKFVYKGKVVWETIGKSSFPIEFGIPVGPPIGRAMMPDSSRPNYDFFRNVKLPKLIDRTAKGKSSPQMPAGFTDSSRVTTAGIK